MYQDVLTDVGLSSEEATLYLSLLENGAQSASTLAASTKIKRTYVYAVAKSLISQGLVREEKKGKTTLFTPLSPDHLLTLAEEKKLAATHAANTLGQLLPTLKNKYAATETKPVITYYEGLQGIQKIYDDIISEQKPLILFRSIYDETAPHLDEILARQLKRQIEKGIQVKTITPLEKSTKETYLKLDKQRLVNRRIVNDPQFLKLPSQILIYGQKVAIISLKDPQHIIATLIDNKEISETMTKIFEHIWKTAETEHQKITKDWSSPNKLPPVPNSST